MARLVTAEGKESVVMPENGEVFTLKELQTLSIFVSTKA